MTAFTSTGGKWSDGTHKRRRIHIIPREGNFLAVRVNGRMMVSHGDRVVLRFDTSSTPAIPVIEIDTGAKVLVYSPLTEHVVCETIEWNGEGLDLALVLETASSWDTPLTSGKVSRLDADLCLWMSQIFPSPAAALSWLQRNRRERKLTRRLEKAFRQLETAWATPHLEEEYDLDRLPVLARRLLPETRERLLGAPNRVVARFARLWIATAVPGRPIGSCYNPDPNEVAKAAWNPAFDRLRRREIALVLGRAPWNARLSRLRMAARAWMVAPDLPYRLAHRVGRMSIRGRLAARVAWDDSRDSQAPWREVESRFWARTRELLSTPSHEWVHRLHSPHLATRAMFPQIGPERKQIASLLYHAAESYAEGDPAMAATEALKHFSPRGYEQAREAFDGSDNSIYPVSLSIVFGRRTAEYLRRAAIRGVNPHDAAQLIPVGIVFEPELARTLGHWLLAHIHSEDLATLMQVATSWEDAARVAGEQIAPDTSPATVLALAAKGGAGQRRIARPLIEAYIEATGSLPPDKVEDRWLAGLTVPPAFPVDKRWEVGRYTGRFLPREDPRGILLGWLTNCCQRVGGAGEECAWHGHSDLHGGFFVVESPTGEVVAQSWVWWRPGEGVCFDNIEGLSLSGRREEAVAAIYEMAARDLAAMGYGRITVGTNYSDLDLSQWPTATPPLLPPGGYTDARQQRVLAEGQATRKKPEHDYVVALISSGEAQAFQLERIAEVCYPPGWQYIDCDADIFLVLLYRGETVGYAAIESEKRYINDVAVLSEHRGRGSLVLLSALLRMMQGIAPEEPWCADCRESTSYRLLKVLVRRGRIRLLAETDAGDMTGESMRRIVFTISPAVFQHSAR